MTLNEFIARATSFFDKAEAAGSTTQAELTKAKADLAASASEITNLKAQIAESANRITQLEADLAASKLSFDQANAELTKAKQSATETIAAQGLKPDALPDAGKQGGTKSQTIAEQWLAITDPKEKTAFYQKHSAEIKACRK